MKAPENYFPREDYKTWDFAPALRHWGRYYECLRLLGEHGRNELWLDCASGSGYGTNFLSNFTENIFGYDKSQDAVNYANKNYKTHNCKFVDNLNLLQGKKFNTIFSVETIEHMPRENGVVFLKTLNNLLRDNGDFVITTPIVDVTNYNPTNEFHDLEYSNKDFIDLLNECGFDIEKSNFIQVTFTDGETKHQGYYKCQKTK